MENSEIKISVIMSSYNTSESYLKAAIKSLLNQTFTDFEILLVNDGGNKINLESIANDNRIKLIEYEEKKGLATRMNECIRMANGKYIARMDCDDYAVKDRLEKQYNFMEKNSKIVMCSGFAKKFGQDNSFIFNIWNKPKEIQVQLFYTNVIVHPSVMFRKSFLIDNNLFYEESYLYSQDFEFWTRLSKEGKIAIISQILLFYRVHNKQSSTDKKIEQRNYYESTLKRNLKELILKEEDLKYIKMLNGSLENVEYENLKTFINKTIHCNNERKIYNTKSLRKVLYNAYFFLCLKNKKINFKYFGIQSLNHIFRKFFTEIKVRLQFIKYKEEYKELEVNCK